MLTDCLLRYVVAVPNECGCLCDYRNANIAFVLSRFAQPAGIGAVGGHDAICLSTI